MIKLNTEWEQWVLNGDDASTCDHELSHSCCSRCCPCSDCQAIRRGDLEDEMLSDIKLFLEAVAIEEEQGEV